jgi:hypothetical protein
VRPGIYIASDATETCTLDFTIYMDFTLQHRN